MPPAKATENIFVLEVAVPVHKAVISGSLDSHTYTAPVIVTGAHATAAQLSKKLNMLSEKLLQVAQTRACQDYFVDIERFLIIISKQLDEDTGAVAGAGATTDGVPITVPVVNPFPAMAGKFPTDVPSVKIIWTSWKVCAVEAWVGATCGTSTMNSLLIVTILQLNRVSNLQWRVPHSHPCA